MAPPSAVQSRRAVGRSTIFHAAGALEQICARALGAPRSEGTRWALGSTLPHHASPSQIENLVSLLMSPTRSACVLADVPP